MFFFFFFWGGDSWGWSSIVVAKYVFFQSPGALFKTKSGYAHRLEFRHTLRTTGKKNPKKTRKPQGIIFSLAIRPFLQWWPCTRNGCGKAVANLSGTLGTSTFSFWHRNGGLVGTKRWLLESVHCSDSVYTYI